MQEQKMELETHTQRNSSYWPKIVGVGIIAALMAAGVYTAASVSPFFGNALSKLAAVAVSLTQTFIPGERIILTASPKSVDSGDEIVLSWTHRNQTGNGIYTLTYPCIDGTYLGVRVAEGDKMLLCDTASQIKSADRNLTLIPISELTDTVMIPVTFSYAQATDTQTAILSTITLSVVGTGTRTSVTTPVVEKPVPVQTHTPVAGEKTEKVYLLEPAAVSPAPETPAYGKADLAPRIIAIGVIDKTTNVFTETATLHAADRIAVKFEIENLGTVDSGNWMFAAVLPTFPMHIFDSESQPSLKPGDRIEYTIGFDQVQPDVDGRFVINVDPTRSLPEATKANNIATTTIRASL